MNSKVKSQPMCRPCAETERLKRKMIAVTFKTKKDTCCICGRRKFCINYEAADESNFADAKTAIKTLNLSSEK